MWFTSPSKSVSNSSFNLLIIEFNRQEVVIQLLLIKIMFIEEKELMEA